MSYSRRQLEAFGEPLGDSITRKEGGRIIYGGGGSSSAPSTQTQISELPDWAKPYAQETLAKTKALTATPYQAYGAPRIAGFSPMQEQAFQTAGQMRPSELGQFGGRVAGAAALGALGTQYDPFQMGQFTSGRAAQYMNPFVEMAMEPQLREAQRASEMQRAADQAQATRAGAFGGSRQAIVEAERQRNLGTQLGDIRARGYMSAFDRAQEQFAREQQLREQSRQYGAGIGLQSLQTALQGAGQLGALGGQEFEQQRGIIGLQQQLGAQQQALRQQGLTQAYQDFLNEQNYPYKQLGFMSDMIRGLPLGQQSTRQLYEPPGSLAGQIGGIGTGLLGLSAMGKMFKEGGEVEDDDDNYAEGGDVTSDYNVDDIISGLSDVQLQQARLAALNSRDQNRLEMIDNELAERASLRGGLGGAFNMLPEESQENVFSAANGGIVAFADGGDVDPLSLIGGNVGPEALARDEARRQAILDRRKAAEDAERLEFLRTAAPEVAARLEKQKPAAAPAAPAASATYADESTRSRAKEAKAPKEKPAAEAAGVSQALNAMAAQTGVSRESLNDIFNRYYKSLSDKGEANMKSIADMIEKSAGRSKEVKEKAMGRALAEFGFNWAAKAAEPGAKFIGSAAKAAPSFAASLAETDKIAREMDQNDLKLRINAKQFEIEQARGNITGAAQLAAQERMLMQAQEQLALKRQELVQQAAYQQGMLGVQRSDVARREAAAKAQGLSALANLQRAQNAMAESARKAALDFDGSAPARALKKQLSEQYDPEKATYLYNQKRREYVRENMQLARDQAEGSTQVPNVFDLLRQE
jgi:hypothetical protein